MTSKASGGGFSKVLYTHVMSDDVVENGDLSHDEDDDTNIEIESLIADNKSANGSKKIKASYFCDLHSLSARVLIALAAVLFITGVVIGILIGRLWFHFAQPEDSTATSAKIEHGYKCNCFNFSSQPHDDFAVSKDTYTTHSTETTPTASNQNFPPSRLTPSSTISCDVCKTNNPVKIQSNGLIASLFSPLTVEEMKAVTIAMKTRNYASYDNKLDSNRLSHIYLYPAVKSEALKYLDNNGLFPGRFAKVHLLRPTNDPPDVMEYRVGPLNVSFRDMTVEKLRKDGEIVFNRRPYDSVERNALYSLLAPEIKTIASLLSESFDKMNDTEDVSPSFSYLPTSDISDRTSNMGLESELGKSSTLRLLPVSCTVHHPGTDVSKWYTSDWYYLNQGPYKTATELQAAYDSLELRKVQFPTNFRKDHQRDFDRVRNASLPARDLSYIPPPRTYEPQGPRYTLTGHKVTWMGWQFEVSSDPVRGPSVFDVRFQSERIAYEISLQDITLLYSSQTNGHGPPVLSDTFYLIGAYNKPIYDVDCPKRSKILKATIFRAGSPIDMDAICVFEADGQRPLWRHGSRGLADSYLVIRAPISVGNYDYIFEWNFFLDGRLQTRLTASGYLYGAFWDPDDPLVADKNSFTRFGYRLGEYLLGPLHDHTFTFKIDLDIYGTENSFQTIQWKSGSTREAFRSQRMARKKPSYFFFNNTRYVNRETLKYENSFNLDVKNPKIWTVVNENKKNAWGAIKGYRIIPHSKYAEILEDHMMLPVWNHIKYQLAVTKRKESEPHATNSLYDITHPVKMLNGSGEMKLDNDSVRYEDLVLWISEKFYHLPTSEDVPMTLPVEAGFTLKPFNYFDRTPVFDLPARYSKHDPYENTACYVND